MKHLIRDDSQQQFALVFYAQKQEEKRQECKQRIKELINKEYVL